MAVQQRAVSGTHDGSVTADEGLSRGLRNVWHPILRSRDLRDRAVGITRLGEDLVLWRDREGRAHCFPDRCPHRAARLSLGYVDGQVLTCGYHGFQFNGSGECTSVPVEGVESRLLTRLKLPSYPVEEQWGLIWAYIGEVDLFPPPPRPVPEELSSPEWSGFICEARWEASWLLIFDNLADPMHGPFLHARSHTLSRGLKFDRLAIRDTEDGFAVERELQRGVNFDWSEVHVRDMLWFRIDIPYPWYAGPGGPMRVLAFATPIDAGNTQIYFLRLRHSAGWQRTLWRLLYRAWWEAQHWKVLEQDRAMLVSQRGLPSRLYEHHAQSDAGVVHLRRLLRREHQRQRKIYLEASERGRPVDPQIAEAEEAQA